MTRYLLTDAAGLAAVDQYGIATVSRATARWFRQSIERLTRHCVAEFVDEVRPLDVARWIEAERGGAIKAVTINSFLRGCKTVFSRLKRGGMIEHNPAEPVPFLREPRLSVKAISERDYLAMRAMATCVRDAAILDVLWSSGCRIGGLLSMRVDKLEAWVAADGRNCYALEVIEKFSQPRIAYVGRGRLQGDGLAAWLEARPLAASPSLWLTMSAKPRPMAPSTIEGVIRQLRIAAGVDGRPSHAHSFRHAFALRLLDEGEDLAAVSDLLGHHDPSFTARRYAIRTESQLREKYFG